MSSAGEQARIAALTKAVDQAGVRVSAERLIATESWGQTGLPPWRTEGGAGREAAKLICSTGDASGLGCSIVVQMELGRTAPIAHQVGEPAITATLDLILRLPRARRLLSLEELRDLLIDALQLHHAISEVGATLLSDRPTTGEGVLYLACSEELGEAIHMKPYGRRRQPRNEIPLHFTLPIAPAKLGVLQSPGQVPSTEARLAVEIIRRTLLWSGAQDYAPELNWLLRSAPR